ncbi:MAG: TrmH family RNA methyltransferase [Phycisphaerales bacterium]
MTDLSPNLDGPTGPIPQRIDALDDPRIDDYRDVRDADLLGRRGVFMAEGDLVVRLLIDSARFRPVSVFLSEKRLDAMGDAIGRLPADTPVYVAAQPVMDDVVGFHIHRGVLAAGRRAVDSTPEACIDALPGGPGLVICCETLANHDNVGGVFRAGAAFGAGAVLLDDRSCDPLYRKAIRVSMGHALRVPFARQGSTAEHIALLQQRGFTVCALALTEGVIDLPDLVRDRLVPERIAVLLGAEGPGLTDESLNNADLVVRIPMAPGVDSLNVAQAAAVACYALRAH